MKKNETAEAGGMELTYHWEGDFLIPDLTIKKDTRTVGKYGRMRQRYLKEHKSGRYTVMLLNGVLTDHLVEIDEAANNRLEQMMPELAKAAGATEELKARDPMKWVGLMNTCKAQAEEIILAELIYN